MFTTPTRAALQRSDYTQAALTNRALTGMGLSRQVFGLRAKILGVDAWLPEARCPVVEVHPEVSFAALNGAPVLPSKKTWAGVHDRMTLMESVGLAIPAQLGELGVHAGPDDVLDAAAVA